MTSTNKFAALAIIAMASGLLVASPAFAQSSTAQTSQTQTAQAQKQRTQDTGPNCDFSVPTSSLSPDCQNIKQGLNAARIR
jgi:hypothetical protein